ncbi:MAG: hypothetical protein LWX11_07450 [Firmicutes bacterium]|nr:hypothetical protein [Bacillota bacterium]
MKGPANASPKPVPAPNSPQRHIPSTLSPKCSRSACLGSTCSGWRYCSPVTAFAGTRFQIR